jgi:hypothetical protein
VIGKKLSAFSAMQNVDDGPSRHLPSCGDLVAIGWKADIAQTSLIGRD